MSETTEVKAKVPATKKYHVIPSADVTAFLSQHGGKELANQKEVEELALTLDQSKSYILLEIVEEFKAETQVKFTRTKFRKRGTRGPNKAKEAPATKPAAKPTAK